MTRADGYDLGAGLGKLSGSGSLRARARASVSNAIARSDNGTLKASPVFILAGGMVQIAFTRSTSRHCAPSVSLVRVAVKMRNSNAKAAMLSDARKRCMKPGTSA